MRRLLRWLVNGLCLLSLLACLGLAWLWWHSYRTRGGAGDHAGAFLPWRRARYTVWSERGRLVLFAPPPRAAGLANAAQAGVPPVGDLADQVSDEQLQWEVARVRASDRGSTYRRNLSPRGRFGTPAARIEDSRRRALWTERVLADRGPAPARRPPSRPLRHVAALRPARGCGPHTVTNSSADAASARLNAHRSNRLIPSPSVPP